MQKRNRQTRVPPTNERQVSKMTKKLLSLVMALALLATAPACAESFFPAIPTKTPALVEYAPSYAECMDITPGQEFILEGNLFRTYEHVTQEDFNLFGLYLREYGYYYEEEDCTFDYDLSAMVIRLTNDSLTVTVTYGWEEEFLAEMYPEGVTPVRPSDNVPTASFDESGEVVARVETEPALTAFSAGGNHTAALRNDGTVAAVGYNAWGQCDVNTWTNIVAIDANVYHTVGLKSDGTVVAVGNNTEGMCDVYAWTGITAISAGKEHTVGLKADGTVVAVGSNTWGQCDVGDWAGVVAVSAGDTHTVGLKADGTVLAVGQNVRTSSYYIGARGISDWTDIVAISAGSDYTVGLKADGTVVSYGKNDAGQLNVDGWTDITAISTGAYHTVGLKADGTVVAVGNNEYGQCDVHAWTDIVAISAGSYHTVGMKADGTLVAVGKNDKGQCDVDALMP